MKSRVEFVKFDGDCVKALNEISAGKKITYHRADGSVVVVEVDGKFGKATKNPDENIPYNCSYFARLLALYRALGLKSKEEALLSKYDDLLFSTDKEILDNIARIVTNTSSLSSDKIFSFNLIAVAIKERKRNG